MSTRPRLVARAHDRGIPLQQFTIQYRIGEKLSRVGIGHCALRLAVARCGRLEGVAVARWPVACVCLACACAWRLARVALAGLMVMLKSQFTYLVRFERALDSTL